MLTRKFLAALIAGSAGPLMACQPNTVVLPPEADIAKVETPLTETTQSALARAIDQAVETEMRDNFIPGVALVVVKDGETIYKQGYGIASVETGQAVNPDTTIFRIGSISKAVSLLALTRLVDEGRISRSDDVTDYFPDIENPFGFESPITVDHLLTHTTGFDQPGFGRQLGGFEYSIEERQAARPSLSEFLADRNLRRANPAGEFFRYDTYSPTLAGVILEQQTGKPYDEAMDELVFAPLGMTRTSVEVEPEHLADLAKGHGYVGGRYETTPYEIYLTPPASSIDATVADMGRFLEALTSDGANTNGRLFSPEMTADILSAHYRPHPEFSGMSHGLWEAFGVGVGEDAIPVRTLGHGGDMWGYNAHLEIIPEFNAAIFAAANRNAEGGGPRVKIGRTVMLALLEALAPGRKATPHPVPTPDPAANLSQYAGPYYWGVYCHTCTEEEFDLGAWPKPGPETVTAQDGTLLIGGEIYVPMGSDIFLRDDGYRRVFFKRNVAGEITSYSFEDDPTVFERGD